jgi:NAD(P)-dependent dehydrogenase (short-subunit alcohol dehydrogenase family)
VDISLQDKIAIVTGGARGIGRAIAEIYLEHGARVMIGDVLPIDRDHPLRAYGDKVAIAKCDVSQDEDVRRLVETTRSTFGRIDILVNNAASPGPTEGIAEIDPLAFASTVQTILGGAYSGARHVTPIMRAQNAGVIINIGSTSALRAASALHAYGAAKAAVSMMTQNLALELAPHGVRVNCICPGGVATALYGLAAGLDAKEAEARIDVVARNFATALPLGRAGAPRDVAYAALFLASDMSAFITGQVIAVDGGMSVGRPLPPGMSPHQFFRRMVGL